MWEGPAPVRPGMSINSLRRGLNVLVVSGRLRAKCVITPLNRGSHPAELDGS